MNVNYPSIPSATYRLQFNHSFKFQDAETIVPYLHSLGITHVYASPIFLASPGSDHGYDVRDHNQLNPELGSRDDFDLLLCTQRSHQMGMILDMVPNHMGVAHGLNPIWMDVLEHGPASIFAHFFDIDWHPPKAELQDKILLPILGQQYGRALEAGEFRLGFDSSGFFVRYFETRLPIALCTTLPILDRAFHELRPHADPVHQLEFESIITAIRHLPARTDTSPKSKQERARETLVIKLRLAALADRSPAVSKAIESSLEHWQINPEDPLSFDALDALLDAQSYRLSYWRVAGEEINFRRFFDINTLAAIRMELPEVFESTHRLVTELMKSGAITGVRIDHVDGLWDIREYCARLQNRFAACYGISPETMPLYVLVEKILIGNERLRADWPVHGTTGYEFINQVTKLFVDPDAEKSLTRTYGEFIGERKTWEEAVYRGKELVTRVSMVSEVHMLGYSLNRLSETNRRYRDFTINSLTTAIREVIAAFPVYRSYIRPEEPVSPEDRVLIERAILVARRRNPAIERSIFAFLRDVILLPTEENRMAVNEDQRQAFVRRFQQITGPVTAKGIEDTAAYTYNRLIALNEVGGEPDSFGSSIEKFHSENLQRLQTVPHTLLATTTHDTKRSEDVRARIAAITEMPEEWRKAVRRWAVANRRHKTELDGTEAPDSNEEYLLYQTLVGSWPMDGIPDETYVERIKAYMTKAIREAKVNSSWIEPNEAWEEAALKFIQALFARSHNRFIPSFTPIAGEIAALGMINSLSQTLLKCTVPGVPDIYRGTELWDLSLVDPDNRRPVDFDLRRSLLGEIADSPDPKELLENWHDGRVKLFLLARILNFRGSHAELFAKGAYSPLATEGTFKNSLLTFCRTHEEGSLLVAVPRLTRGMGFPPVGPLWRNTHVSLSAFSGTWRDIFTGRHLEGTEIPASDLLGTLPFAALEKL